MNSECWSGGCSDFEKNEIRNAKIRNAFAPMSIDSLFDRYHSHEFNALTGTSKSLFRYLWSKYGQETMPQSPLRHPYGGKLGRGFVVPALPVLLLRLCADPGPVCFPTCTGSTCSKCCGFAKFIRWNVPLGIRAQRSRGCPAAVTARRLFRASSAACGTFIS